MPGHPDNETIFCLLVLTVIVALGLFLWATHQPNMVVMTPVMTM